MTRMHWVCLASLAALACVGGEGGAGGAGGAGGEDAGLGAEEEAERTSGAAGSAAAEDTPRDDRSRLTELLGAQGDPEQLDEASVEQPELEAEDAGVEAPDAGELEETDAGPEPPAEDAGPEPDAGCQENVCGGCGPLACPVGWEGTCEAGASCACPAGCTLLPIIGGANFQCRAEVLICGNCRCD